jgi:spore coat polysaccharide biosynthesis protein SpsF
VRTGIFVQVRLGSTRLPGKALLPLAGSTVIGHVMKALREVPVDVYALLTDPQSAPALRGEAVHAGFEVFAGHPTDVLGRFCAGCRALSVARVVRATGDNPLVCPRLARDILALHGRRRADLSHYLGIPWGSGVEVVEAQALFMAEARAVNADEREHLTTFHYRNPGMFRIVEEPAPADAALPDGRVTVDTAEDYSAARAIFDALYTGRPLQAPEVVSWLKSRAEGADHA